MKNIILSIFISLFMPFLCFGAESVKKQVKKGNLLYNKNEFNKALENYEKASQELPDSDVVDFNLGAATYKLEDYESAINYFQKSLLSDDELLQAKASFNLGNSKYKYGITKEDLYLNSAVNLLEQSLVHYEHILDEQEQDDDAKYNYEFVQKELIRLKEKLVEQNKQQNNCDLPKDDSDKQEKQESKLDQSGQSQEDKNQAKSKEGQEGQDQQDKLAAEQQQGDKSDNSKGDEENQGQMSKDQAVMLLDDYRETEEPESLYRQKIPVRGLAEPLRDW